MEYGMKKPEEKCRDCLYQKGNGCILTICFLDVEKKEETIQKLSEARKILREKKRLRH